MQFDVAKLGTDGSLVVNCQSDLLSHLKTRFVIPLVPADLAPPGEYRLTPRFEIGGEAYVLAPHFAASLPTRLLDDVVASLSKQHLLITGAIDVLISGV